jgi:hypothetical protein
VFLPAIALGGCDLFNASLVDYLLDHSEIAEATGFTALTRHALEDGTILIPPGEAAELVVSLANPRGFTVRQELLGIPPGKTVSARQTGATEIAVAIAGPEEGDEYDLTLALQSPDGLRDFPSYALRIRCVPFATTLWDLRLDGASLPDFDPARGSFQARVPYARSTLALGGTTEHSTAMIELYAGAEAGDPARLLAAGTHTAEAGAQDLAVGENRFSIRVIAPRLGAAEDYALTVYRASASESGLEEFYFAAGALKYGLASGAVPGSGSLRGDALGITLPYGTDLGGLAARAA